MLCLRWLRSTSTPSPVRADRRICEWPFTSLIPSASPVTSALLRTTVIGSLAGRALDKVWPDLRRVNGAGGGAIDHKQHPNRPGQSPARRGSMPIRSTSSLASRRPAVSMICSGMPSIWICSRSTSRVVPGDIGDDPPLRGPPGRSAGLIYRHLAARAIHHFHPFAQQAALTSFKRGRHRDRPSPRAAGLQFCRRRGNRFLHPGSQWPLPRRCAGE
ncbi:Uncharacterised protein [Klebsiella pneumoniae subsp. rhinoscleromatis]|nr:Uncharacterised protein [Klebsiella pneumoniae subsp. rhinoscleromatis]